MKLPIPLLLYTVSTGLVGVAGWQVYEMLPLLKKETRDEATGKGIREGTDKLGLGKGSGPETTNWVYTDSTRAWWAEFKDANFLGKLPPPPDVPKPAGPEETKKPVDVRPLEQIFELVSLVYDSKDQGKGEISHVIVRYKPEANVQPPEWYVRETTAPTTPSARPGDGVPMTRQGGNPAGPQGKPNPARATTQMPTSMIGRDVLQKVWVQGDGNPRRDPKLWPPFDDIKLVRVDPSAQSAYFVRTPLPGKPGDPPVEPQEEKLLKSAMGMDQSILRELDRLNGRESAPATGQITPVAPSANTWLDTEETTRVGKVTNIGRKDEKLFREGTDDLLSNINVDPYVGSRSGTKGLRVLNVDPQIASRFGVAAGEVLLSVNNRPVTTKAQAMQFGKGEYQKGVRTFVTRWLAGGQEVERIYQAPDR